MRHLQDLPSRPMKQLIQDLASGEVDFIDVPTADPPAGMIQIELRSSVISSGTERSLLEFGQASLLGKALQQPERVKQVMDKARAEGVLATFDAIQARLERPHLPGYAAAGVITAVGEGVQGFSVGERVCCNGPHAQRVVVSPALCARLPENVTFSQGAFATLAAIALHGIRLADVSLGERVAVIGLGLIGQLVADLLRAAGCEVIGVEPNAERRDLARARGHVQCVDLDTASDRESVVDAAIICAASDDASPITLAAQMCRRRGRIVLVGVADIAIQRRVFYDKELTFQVSSSYGPGRYDRAYEERGAVYPLEHVRWTAQRNFEAALAQMERGTLDVEALVDQRFDFEDAPDAYTVLANEGTRAAILLEYKQEVPDTPRVRIEPPITHTGGRAVGIGVIGAGNYAHRTFLPLLGGESSIQRYLLASATGVSAAWLGKDYGFEFVAANASEVFDSPRVDLVCVLTRHDTHAEYAIRALEAGKHVFVEKPLARDLEELERVVTARARSGGMLAVGFNRRFAPMTVALRDAIAEKNAPCSILMTINAGALPRDHWLFDQEQGGRILGEACHFIDLSRALVGARITETLARGAAGHDPAATIFLSFEDGSRATILYETRGASSFPKERIEVSCDGSTACIDDWRALKSWGWPGLEARRTLRADKGHKEMLRAILRACRGEDVTPISLSELAEVSQSTILAARQCQP